MEDRRNAIIFDLDGTILNNENAYSAAFSSVLTNLGAHVDTNPPETIGLGMKENWVNIISKYHIQTDKTPEELAQDTDNFYLKSLKQIRPAAGLYQLLDDLKKSGWLLALATSSYWWIVEKELEQFQLEDRFDIITTAEEVIALKPAPDIYLETLAKLGVIPESCIIIENSIPGVKAGTAANMKVVAIASIYQTADELKTVGATLVVNSLAELSSDLLSSLLP
jgi:HAD superfamily hydrolase (TIGR01509 family)